MNGPPMSSDEERLAAARAGVEALRTSLAAREGGPVQLVETHISWVLLTGTHAYKLKKPLRLPFLDFSTLAARRHACDEELRLNRRLAPSIQILSRHRHGPSSACDGFPSPEPGSSGTP